MLQSYHITMIIIGTFLLGLTLIHAVRWTAIGLKHGWPVRHAAEGGEVRGGGSAPGSTRIELGKEGALDGRREQ